nr:hypothetical protein Iba_chr07eCG5560 [Ipomoea batatas]GMD20525.1 hypothetical protein Iba_chr07fCG5700 [Ipomoea batatas]
MSDVLARLVRGIGCQNKVVPGTTRPGSRLHCVGYLPSVNGLVPGSAAPSAVGPALVSTATSVVGPAETPATGTDACPSGIFEKGVGPRSGTSSGSTARILGRSSSSIETSKAAQTSFCMARRPLLNAQIPNSYIRSSPMGVRETAATMASPVSRPRQMCWASKTGSVSIFSLRSARSKTLFPVSSAVFSLPPSSLIRCSHFARAFLSGATSRRWISSPSFARANRSRAMRSPTKAVNHPLVCSGGGAAAQILVSMAARGSSPCFISTSITGVVEPDPSRLIFVAGAGGRADTGKLLMAPEKGRKEVNIPASEQPDLNSVALTNLVNLSRRGRSDGDRHYCPFGRILLAQVISEGLESRVRIFLG